MDKQSDSPSSLLVFVKDEHNLHNQKIQPRQGGPAE